MASPSHAPPGSTTSWKSPTVHANEQYNRLRTLAYHAGFAKSPFFPKDAMAYSTHNLAFKTDNADQLKLRIRETLEVQKRKMDRAWWYEVPDEVIALYGSDHPAVMARMGMKKGAKGKKKGKVSSEGPVEIAACMERLGKVTDGTEEPIGDVEFESSLDRIKHIVREFQERIHINEIKNRNTEKGLSKVLGLPTSHWKGNEATLAEGKRGVITEKSRAYWPALPELKAEGDDRVKVRGLKRRLPLPRLDMLSKERVAEIFWERFDANDNDAKSEENIILDMVEMTDRMIEPEHRAIVEYKGPIDALDCIARKYEEYRKEMLEETEKKDAEEMKTLMAPSTATTHVETPVPINYGNENGHFRQKSSSSHYVHVPGTQFVDAPGNVHQATFSPSVPIQTVLDASGNLDHAFQALPYGRESTYHQHARSHGSNTHGHKKHARNIPPRVLYAKENGNFLSSTGYNGPGFQHPYNYMGSYDGGNIHQYGYNGESSAGQGNNEPYATQRRFGGADFFNSTASGADGSRPHEKATESDGRVGEMMDEKELRERVGWADLFDALDA